MLRTPLMLAATLWLLAQSVRVSGQSPVLFPTTLNPPANTPYTVFIADANCNVASGASCMAIAHPNPNAAGTSGTGNTGMPPQLLFSVQCIPGYTGNCVAKVKLTIGMTTITRLFTCPPNMPAGSPAVLALPTNTAASSLAVDGVQGSPAAPAVVTRCPSTPASLGVASSNVGLGWELAIAVGPLSLPGATSFFTLSGQPLVVDVTAPTTTFWNGGNAPDLTQPFLSPSLTVPFTTSAGPLTLSGQAVHLDPGTPGGLVFSQGTQLDTVPSATVTGPNGDDSSLQIFLGTSGLCVQAVNFVGTTYSDIFVNSNGSVTFGAGDADFTPTVAEFVTNAPKVAGMWTDLSPNMGGTISTTASTSILTVAFTNVPSFGSPGSSNSVSIDFNAAMGSTTIRAYGPSPTHAMDTLVGLTPGGGATPVPVSFVGLLGGGLQAGTASEAIVELTPGAAVPGGWSSILFPTSDGTSYTVL